MWTSARPLVPSVTPREASVNRRARSALRPTAGHKVICAADRTCKSHVGGSSKVQSKVKFVSQTSPRSLARKPHRRTPILSAASVDGEAISPVATTPTQTETAEHSTPPLAAATARVVELVGKCEGLGMARPNLRLNVAGEYGELKLVDLMEQCMKGEVKEPTDIMTRFEDLERRLKGIFEELGGEEEVKQPGSMETIQSMLTDNSNLSDEEMKEMSGMMGDLAYNGLQSMFWSSMLLLAVGLTLFNFVRGGG